MSKKPKLSHHYYAARKCPDDALYSVKRSHALQWHLEYIIKSTTRYSESLHDDIYGKRYYLQRIKWEDVDLLTAFDIPCIDAATIGVEFNLVVPQLIDNGNGTQSVSSEGYGNGELKRIKKLTTYKSFMAMD